MDMQVNKWVLIVLPCLAFGVLVAVLQLRQKKRAKDHLKNRAVLTDEGFLKALGTEHKEVELILSIRAAVAAVLNVPPQTLQPSDSMAYIKSLGFDFGSFIIELEALLSVDMDYEAIWKAVVSNKDYVEPATLEEFTELVLSKLTSAMQ